MTGIFGVFKKQINLKQDAYNQKDNQFQNISSNQDNLPQQNYSMKQQPQSSQTIASATSQMSQSSNEMGNPTRSFGRTSTNSQQSKKEDQNNQNVISQKSSNKQEELDIMTHLTQRSNRVFVLGFQKAKELQNELIDSEHILFGLLGDAQIYNLLNELKVYPQIIHQELQKSFQKGNAKSTPQPSPRIKLILQSSLANARKLGFDFISPEHMLIALFEEGEGVGARILAKLGIKKEDLYKKITGKKEVFEHKDIKASTSQSVLEQFTKDLTAKAQAGELDPVVERSDVIERVIHILSRRTKNNPALVGEAGVGKTAIVEGLAQKIVKKEVPETLFNKRVLELDLMSILAGASHRGEFEERMKKLIEEISASDKSIILFIDEIHNLVGAGGGGEGSLDASNFLKPSLARGEIQMIGATTLTEYRKYIEKDPALERRFQQVLVPEPTEEQAIKMLKALRDKYEAFHKVRIPDSAIEAAVKLSKRYIGDRFLPDKAIDLIDEAGSAVRLPLISLPEEIRSIEDRIKQLIQEKTESEKIGEKVKVRIIESKLSDLQAELKNKKEYYDTKKSQTTTEVSIDIIKDIISRWTGIPVSKIAESETEKLKKLEDIMHQRLINQERAVSSIAQAVRRGRAGLKSTQKPIGSFVFLGPTGVGKTELAKTLAEVLFGVEEAIIRLDMTEFMEKHEIAKLLGAPPGYVGYEEGGKLTEAVRRKPYSVVLFDEVEKAHPDIFNILLQILDDGRLTDNKGHVISFKNTVVICTSNIGSTLIQDEIIKTGNLDIQEPPVFSTYTYSPNNTIIASMLNKIFIKSGSTQWKTFYTNEYFANQNIESTENISFPLSGFNTHAFTNEGAEYISAKNFIFIKEQPNSTTWKAVSLEEYFKGCTLKLSSVNQEQNQFPIDRIKTHHFSPDGNETISFRDQYITRKKGSKDWTGGELKNYFLTNITKNGENKKTDFLPIQYWDIHTTSPDGTEYIIANQFVWIKDLISNQWTKKPISFLVGDDFPLDKELLEKQKIEDQMNQKQYTSMKSKVMNELRKFFKPELINRFDEVIIFEPLKFNHMTQIVSLQMKNLRKLLEEQNIGFSWSQNSLKEIARLGFDPIFGARPLKRTIQKYIENPISTLIIEGKVNENDTIIIDYDGQNFLFNIEKTVHTNTKNRSYQKTDYLCEKCGKNFNTYTVPTSTIICPYCSSKNIHQCFGLNQNNIKEEKEKKTFEIKKIQQNNTNQNHASNDIDQSGMQTTAI